MRLACDTKDVIGLTIAFCCKRSNKMRSRQRTLPQCVPSMIIDLEVEVLWEVGRNDPSEPQGDDRERVAESSGERDLWGDEQKPDMRRSESGRAGI